MDTTGDPSALGALGLSGDPVRYFPCAAGSNIAEAVKFGLAQLAERIVHVYIKEAGPGLAAELAGSTDPLRTILIEPPPRPRWRMPGPRWMRKEAAPARRRAPGSAPVSAFATVGLEGRRFPGARQAAVRSSATRPLAGTVLFNPDPDIIRGLISAVAGEVEAIIVIANSPLSASQAIALRLAAGRTELALEEHPENIGLAGAYTRITEMAAARGAGEIILFDQRLQPRSRSPSRGSPP